MIAISLWEPWATAIAVGSKVIETRSWRTDYRGSLAIHAAKRCVRRELLWMAGDPIWRAALGSVDFGFHGRRALTFGAIICVCELVDCRPTESFTAAEIDVDRGGWTERDMGDFSPGRFGWVLRCVRRLKQPRPFVGRQGFFTYDGDLD